MATHILVNPDVITSTTFEKAFLDVSGEPLNADVKFTVYGIGAPSAKIATRADERAELRHVTGAVRHVGEEDRPDRRQTTDPSTPSTAVLRQQLGPIKEALTIPSSNIMQGRSFNLPLGDLSGGANLYIGNPTRRTRSSTCSMATAPRPWCRR